MVDTTLISDVNGLQRFKRSFQFSLANQIVTIHNDGGDTPDYEYSDDANASTLNASISTAVCANIGAFAEWLNPSLVSPAALVHVAWLDATNDKLVYAQIDLTDWSLSTPVDVATGLTGLAANSGRDDVAVVVADSGDIYIAASWDDGTTLTDIAFRSTTGGASFSGIAAPQSTTTNGNRRRSKLAFPASAAAADEDFGLLVHDDPGADLVAYTYDQSGNSWTSTTVFNGTGTDRPNALQRWNAGIDTDGQAIAVRWTALNSSTADLDCWKVTFDLTPSVATLTDVVVNPDLNTGCAVLVDWATGDLYAIYGYAATTYQGDGSIYYKLSDDDGVTWGAEQGPINVTADDLRSITCSPAVNNVAGEGGWFQPAWNNDDLADWVTNLDNDIDFTRGGVGPLIGGKLVGGGLLGGRLVA